MPIYTLTCVECGFKFDEDVPVMEFGETFSSTESCQNPDVKCESHVFKKQDISLTANMHQSWEKTTQGIKELPKGKEAAKAAHAKQHEIKRGYKNKGSLVPKAKMQQ